MIWPFIFNTHKPLQLHYFIPKGTCCTNAKHVENCYQCIQLNFDIFIQFKIFFAQLSLHLQIFQTHKQVNRFRCYCINLILKEVNERTNNFVWKRNVICVAKNPFQANKKEERRRKKKFLFVRELITTTLTHLDRVKTGIFLC